MDQLVPQGTLVHTTRSGMRGTVGELLGQGGQGEVYRLSLGGSTVALKWYYRDWATSRQHRSLERLCRTSSPDSRFLWPADLASAETVPGFGYVMPLRSPGFRSIVDLMNREGDDPSFATLARVGLRLSECFLHLHAHGLSYRDISASNLYFDHESGEVEIVDNDNVTFDGEQVSGIRGTPRFMAPEVVRGEASPSTRTDLFSLAVLLFCLLVLHHPFDGRREFEFRVLTEEALAELYGRSPVFVFDPGDDSNRPVPGYQDNVFAIWPLLPMFIKELFIQSFTVGVADPAHGRVTETQWCGAMGRLFDCLMPCPSCGAEAFFDDALGSFTSRRCWNCSISLPVPLRLRIEDGSDSRVVVLHSASSLATYHVNDSAADNSPLGATIVPHPLEDGVLGLRNNSTGQWSTRTGVGGVAIVPPGSVVRLTHGRWIDFGVAQAMVEG